MAARANDNEVSSSESDLVPAEIPMIRGEATDINIKRINSTLTEVHQQYHKLLQKYSRALNLIDDLKCQLAYEGCTKAKPPNAHAFDKLYEENRSQIYDSCSWQWSSSQISTASARERSAQQTGSYENLKHSSPTTLSHENTAHSKTNASHTRSISGYSENDAGLQLFTELFSSPESNVGASLSTSNSSLRDMSSSTPSLSCCQTQVERLSKSHRTSRFQSTDQLNREDVTKPSHAEQKEKRFTKGQQSCHQIAIVYPAQRSIKLCSMGCCRHHSCCCCSHSQADSVSQSKTPTAEVFSDEEQARRPHVTNASNTQVAASELLKALQDAVKKGAELRKSSSDLLHYFE